MTWHWLVVVKMSFPDRGCSRRPCVEVLANHASPSQPSLIPSPAFRAKPVIPFQPRPRPFSKLRHLATSGQRHKIDRYGILNFYKCHFQVISILRSPEDTKGRHFERNSNFRKQSLLSPKVSWLGRMEKNVRELCSCSSNILRSDLI